MAKITETRWAFNQESLAKSITGRLDARGITLREAAKEIGINHSTLWRVQNMKGPDVNTVVVICQWLGMTVDSFVERPRV